MQNDPMLGVAVVVVVVVPFAIFMAVTYVVCRIVDARAERAER
jgi:hypothetical protein